MNEKSAQSRSILLVSLGVALVASIAVACGTFLAPPIAPLPAPPESRSQAQAAAPTPASTDTPQPAPTAAPTDTPQPAPTAAPTDTPQPAPPTLALPSPTDTPAPSPTPAEKAEKGAQESGMVANVEHGQELFNNLGCVACHGPQGAGLIGPTIAQTELPLARVVRQYRAPYQNMPRFGPDRVSEADIADIYAYLHTLPTPQTRVPSVLAHVTPEAGIGTIQGTILYRETGRPAANEQIYVVAAAENADGTLTFTYAAHLPAGVTDAQGHFEIADLEAPQLYGVFYTRQEAPVFNIKGGVILVNVLPGEVAEVEGVIPSP